MVCTSLGSLLRPLFYFLCYIHFSLSVDAGLDALMYDVRRSLMRSLQKSNSSRYLKYMLAPRIPSS